MRLRSPPSGPIAPAQVLLRAACAGLPREVPAEQTAQLQLTPGAELLSEMRRDLAVLEPLDVMATGSPGAEAIEYSRSAW